MNFKWLSIFDFGRGGVETKGEGSAVMRNAI